MKNDLLYALAAVAVFGAVSASDAALHEFPSVDSTVVGSVGFIDDDEIGHFWSMIRGDSVEESFADALPQVTQAIFDFSVPGNVLSSIAVEWDVLINGVGVGDFSIAPGFTGDVHLDLSFAPIPADGGMYEVRFEVTNEIPPGGGSHTLAYAGDWQHSVQLIPAPASLIALAIPLAGRRRRRH